MGFCGSTDFLVVSSLLSMENPRGKEWNCTEKSKEGECQMFSQPSTSLAKAPAKETKRKKSVNDNKDTNSKKKAQDTDTPKPPRKKVIVPPLPVILPPVNEIHRDVVRGWCQKLKLSTRGQKLDAYKRLWKYAYPDQKPYMDNIPDTSQEARVKTTQKKLKTEKVEMLCSDGTSPSEVILTPAHLPALNETPVLYEEVSTTVVTTSAPEAVLASWARIAASAGRMEAEEPQPPPPPEAQGYMWCVVHGKSLPADSSGWVRLQFHAGQAWVPEKKGRVSALFLLPACTFPPPNLEDNMLCPRCVQRNKVLIKSLQ
ncbi:developmental pluripotency-associated protein 4 [Nannospalax galili]|uniref:developmental pluripotency-associated protein 4 n=1 Tax=Nannospalax galili TaxID=1026970 RepID=UPI0004ED2E7D|nr:developmental pluripotency-associated protein 4 [Nannospalax galili]